MRRLRFEIAVSVLLVLFYCSSGVQVLATGGEAMARCQGCLEGHIKKALKEGAPKEEIAEAIAMGVNAAVVVDLTDIAAAHLDLEFFK